MRHMHGCVSRSLHREEIGDYMINFTINGRPVQVEIGTTILEAANTIGIKIPTLCHLDLHNMKMVNQSASCRVCMVEVKGIERLLAACSTPAWEGMEVRTDTLKVIKTRRMMIELLLTDHPKDCLVCNKNGDCELQHLVADNQIRKINYEGKMRDHHLDDSSLSLVRDMSKCILCKRCESMCNEIQTVGALTDIGRGFETSIGTLFDLPMHETACTFCGQCLAVCPTGALTEVNNVDKVWDALSGDKFVIVQTAPAVRVALGELFGMEPGTIVTGKMVSALRSLGFDRVYDTNFAADITIMEEAAEMVHRVRHGGNLPILTSCCPSWVKFIEHNFGDMLDIPSTCKSPHEMFGSVAKTYLADKLKIKPENIVVVSVMPCVAKKYESARPELGQDNGLSDVDIVITTRELAQMLKDIAADFPALPEDDFDNIMGMSSGAGTIFGTSGGVLEASLRTAYEWLTGKELENVNFKDLRGLESVKEAEVDIDGMTFRVAKASGLGSARKMLQKIRDKEVEYHAIEIMACPGGCIGGGGQPYIHGNEEILKKRMEAIYREDSAKYIRQSHKNPMVIKFYEEFIGEPYGEKAHELLHTHYTYREKM